MNSPNHSTYSEWLNLEADGALPPDQEARLERHVASCAECRTERAELAGLGELLRRSSLPVRPDFRDSVLAALPAAGWEARNPRAWRLPAAVFVLLGVIAAALVGAGLTADGAGSSGLEALLTVAGMFGASIQAGAGLLNATRKGVELVGGEMFSSSGSLAVFGVLVLCLDLLLVSLLRRRRPVRSEAPAGRRSRGDS